MLFRGKGDRAKKGRKSAERKIFSPLLCQLSYLAVMFGGEQLTEKPSCGNVPAAQVLPRIGGLYFLLPLRLDLRKGSFSLDKLTGWHC